MVSLGKNHLCFFNVAVFLQSQIFMLPVLLLFYFHNGLTTGDFFLFQGIFSLACLILEIPTGYLSDLFPKKNILILSYSCFIIRLLLWFFFAHLGYWIILTGELLYALQKSFFSGASDGYIYEYLKQRSVTNQMLKSYGQINSFMSMGTAFSSLVGALIYHAVSAYTLTEYHQNYGFLFLIGMELLLNIAALFFLLKLPQISCSSHPRTSLWFHYQKFFYLIKNTFKNINLRFHIIYAGVLASLTIVFVWNFQPIMKMMAIPVSFYGGVYFFNHLCRAIASWKLDRIIKFLSLAKLGILCFVLFCVSFIASFIILNKQPLALEYNLFYFVFISVVIGLQFAFNLSNTSRLHYFTTSKTRGTISSINVAVSRLFNSLFLILLKFLIDDFSLSNALMICMGVSFLGIIPLYYVFKISLLEKK